MTAAPLELAEVGDCIRDQLHALDSNPNPSRAADVAANLDGARRAVLRLRGALLKEVTP